VGSSAFEFGDAAGDLGIEQTVVGSLGSEPAQGAEVDVDGGGGEALLLEACAVGLEQSL
jgi:hypothetical protein